MNYDAIAIGAGLSGCSAAIQLAKLGYRVLLLEQSHYPMHKLCGEFLSVEVTAAFEHLGILEQVHKIGAQPIHRAYLTTANGASFRSKLPSTALGLSRYQLDLMLFQRSQAVNVTCIDNIKVTGVTLYWGHLVNAHRSIAVLIGHLCKSDRLGLLTKDISRV